MNKKLFLGIVTLMLLFRLSSKAQDTVNHYGCGLYTDYLLSMAVDSPGYGATALLTPPSSFPPVAIKSCGKFQIYYEDLIPGAPIGGFNEPGGIGIIRQNTLCAVLTYIESVYDFSNIPSGKYIRLHVDNSWSAANPIPVGGVWPLTHGACAPYFKTSAISPGAVLNGFVHDYITSTTGTDPNPGDYHANLQMNFDKIERRIFDFSRSFKASPATSPLPSTIVYNNGVGSSSGCEFDLYGILLHMVSHSLGWFSWKDYDPKGTLHGTSPSSLPQSNYDMALSGIDDPRTTINPFGSSTFKKLSPSFGSRDAALINNNVPPYNAFVGNVDVTGISHYSHLIINEFVNATRITPGDKYNPVMGMPFIEGNTSREFTKLELLHFRDVIGLGIKTSYASTHSTLLNNRLAWSSKMNSNAYNFIYQDRDFAEKVSPDYTINNDIVTTVVINLNSDPSLHDADGDQLSVMEGTLVNFRGCGNGGNNHAQISLSSTNQVITYTPRHNFYGRAQFGFNLWDGKEKGAFVIYTIDVLPGTNVSAPLGTEMVVNGNFEEGDEVKIKTTEEAVNNTYSHGPAYKENYYFGGRFNNGTIMSDGHPYDAFTNYFYGTAIKNSYAECSYAANNLSFGHPANSFPWSSTWTTGFGDKIWRSLHGGSYSDGFPDAKVTGSTNNRYQPLGQEGILFNLATTMKECARYVLEFDARRTYTTPISGSSDSYTYPSVDQLDLDFTQSSLITDLSTISTVKNYSFPIPKIDDKNWEHFKVSFTYCVGTTANVFRLKIKGALANDETIATVLLDNVSLIETPFALSIKIIDDPKQGCNRTIYAGPETIGCPTMTYEWKDATGTVVGTSRGLTISALDYTFYTVTVSDGCSTASDRIDIEPCPCSPVTVLTKPYTTLTTGSVPSVLAPGKYYVPANLVLSGTTDFNNVLMLIEPGVQITVPTTAKLTIDNSHLFVCPDTTKMWRGIVLASTGPAAGGSSAQIEVKNNTLIEDALFAIDALDLKTPASGDVIKVTNSTFNRNQVDISMNGYKVSSPALLPITIKDNLFTARLFDKTTMSGYPAIWASTGTLKAATAITDARPSYVISKSYTKVLCKDNSIFSYLGVRTNNIGLTSTAGVYQSEVKIGEGAAVEDYNLFDNHRYGLVSYNSNLSLYHNHFINISRRMIPDASTTAPIDNGMAVVLVSDKTNNTRAQILPAAFGNLTNKFHDCFMGIYTENIATLNINSARITTSNTAGATVAGAAYPSETYAGFGMMIHSEGILKSNTITGNVVSNVGVGITMGLFNPKTGENTLISNNNLKAQNPDISSGFTTAQCMVRGIDLYSSGGVLGTANTITINNNDLDKVFNGISFQGFTNIKCSTTNNNIKLWDYVSPVTDRQYGIQAIYTNEATITANNRISTPTLNPVVALANRIRAVTAASNTSLRICDNTSTNIGRGFEFAPGYAQTGTRWIGNSINNGYMGMVLASDIGDQGLMYNHITMMPWTYWGAIGNKWTGTWSSAASKNQTVGIDYINTMNSKLWVKDIPAGTLERPTVNVAIPTAGSVFPNFYDYLSTTRSILIAQQEANCHGAIYPTKYNPIPKGSYTNVKTLGHLIIADSLGYDSSYRIRQWMSQLSLYELGTIDPELRDSSAALDSFMIAAAGSRYAWLTDIELAINQDDWATAQSLLNSPVGAMGRVVVNGDLIITDEAAADGVVANYHNYYSAYIHYLQDSMTGADSSSIAAIAHKCPVRDGVVVYKARALYQRINLQSVLYNDDSCDSNNGGQYRMVQDASLSGGEAANSYSLYPNPNRGTFVLKQAIAENKSVNLKVYNAIGALVYQSEATFVNGQMGVDLGQKAQGIYLVCIGDQKERTTCLRFIIQ